MIRRRTALALAAAAAVAGCRSEKPSATLAVAAPLSGDLAAEGKGMERAVRLAVQDAGAELPYDVAVKVYDDRGDAGEAGMVASTIAADPKVFAVVGHLTSGCSLEASRVYAVSGLAMITPSATAPDLTVQQTRLEWAWPRVVFRLPPSDVVQGGYAAGYAFDRFNLRRIVVVHDRTAYGLGLAREFQAAFQKRGGAVLGVHEVARGQRDFAAVAQRLVASRPDGVFYGGVYAEAGLLLKALRAAGLRGAFMAGDGSKTKDLFAIAGPAAHGAYVTVSGVPVEHLPSAVDFVARYKQRYPDADVRAFDHYAYEAARIALAALKRSGPDRAKIVEAVRSHPYSGMIGTIVFDGKGDTLKSVITMTRANFQEKTFEPIY